MTATPEELGKAVGSGSGWLLVDDSAAGGRGSFPEGFAPATEPGSQFLASRWKESGFEPGILWLHQTSTAAVLAVPTSRLPGPGLFQFFLWRGFGPVVHMPAWSTGNGGGSAPADFEAARAAARAFGNAALGIGRRPA